MKRTLFNTMMGCLAALSLAGCGGSGGGSDAGGDSSWASESLISEGFEEVAISTGTAAATPGAAVYGLRLYSSGQKFELSLLKGGTELSHKVEGTWGAKSLGNGKFELWLGDALDKGCTIHGRTVELTIDNMAKYGAGEYTWATLDKAPFTHEGAETCGYSCDAEQKERAEIQQF